MTSLNQASGLQFGMNDAPQAMNRLQVTAPVQQTLGVQQTAPAGYFQPAANPQGQYSYYNGGGGGGGATGGGGAGGYSSRGYDPYAAQRAAEARKKQEEENQKAQIRGSISGLIDQAMGVYDTLYGNVNAAATSQKQALEKRYNQETGSLTDQFNIELPKIGRGYAGRGVYDSSYRQEAEGQATKGYQTQLDTLQTGLESDKQKIGQELISQQANIGVGKSLLDLTKQKLGEVTDLGELRNTQNEIQKKIAELQGTVQSTGTREGYLKKFGELAPAADRLESLQSTLRNIIDGQAPPALKRAVAQQIIGSSGLSKDEENALNAQVIQQIG